MVTNISGWLYKKVSFAEIAGVVKPICERFPFSKKNEGTVLTHPGRLIGASILAENDIEGVRIHIYEKVRIIDWGMSSDALSISEQSEFLSLLPKGDIDSFISPPLPPLMKDSSTTLIAIIAHSGDEICYNPNWLKVTANERNFLYADKQFYSIRGLSIFFKITLFNLFIVSFFLAVTIVAIIKRKWISQYLGNRKKHTKSKGT